MRFAQSTTKPSSKAENLSVRAASAPPGRSASCTTDEGRCLSDRGDLLADFLRGNTLVIFFSCVTILPLPPCLLIATVRSFFLILSHDALLVLHCFTLCTFTELDDPFYLETWVVTSFFRRSNA
jgi:hypothetical protein